MEQQWDKLLKIKTSGRDDTKSDCFRYPYEPTPYAVLERLANSGFIRKQDVVLDYGCGKGRVDFFLAYQTRAHCVGVEYDERIIAVARENQKTAVSAGRVEILLGNAETFYEETMQSYLSNPADILFDCEKLNFIDSTTLGTFVKILKKLKENGHTVRLKNLQAKIKKLFLICSLDKIMEIA